jgi:hypothetical protein
MSRPAIDDAAALDELRLMMGFGCKRSTALATVKRNSGASEADRHRWARKLRAIVGQNPMKAIARDSPIAQRVAHGKISLQKS